ncbi:ABC transporter permease [Nocardioides bizhenqiangii]|uniref:ABC transporter permease n=1 Tax=Nocardioides bizhenqiangii TaxID=3095076 RepID=A0ABZ0ZTD9_9ACTN|nr:ABC transporter permease [Nocardioides sp. HM61]WQQ27560.1 ABC transporter permease [Nocardioides sp. HM61]
MSVDTVPSSRGAKARERIVAPVVFLGVLLLAWHLATSQDWVSSLVLPPPKDVVVSTYELFETGLIWEHLFATLYETLAGFALAASVALMLALAAGWSTLLRNMIQPYAVVLQVMPMLSLAPIIISTFGFGYQSKIVVAALISFFPVFVNTLTGLLLPDPQEEELFRSLGAGRAKTFRYVLMPTAAPLIFAGLRIGLTLALAGAIVAEFVSAQVGLGLLVQRFSYQLNLDDAFAVIFVLTAMGLALYGLIALVGHLVVFWRREAALNRRSAARMRRYQRRIGGGVAPAVEPAAVPDTRSYSGGNHENPTQLEAKR